MFSLLPLSKSKFFTCVAIVLFVSNLCRTRITPVALSSHSCPTFVVHFLLMSRWCHLVLHSSRTGVVRVALMSLVSGTCVVKLSISSPKPDKMFKNTNTVFEFRHFTQMRMKVYVKKKIGNGTPNASEALIIVQHCSIKIPKLS